jgi:hypothetical protein
MVHTYETITLHPINMYSYLPIQKKKKKTRLGIVTHTANPASQEAETISD